MNPPSSETRDDLIIVARAVRTRGLKGELLADVLTDFPERFEQVSELTGVSLSGERKQFELENHWFQNDRMVLKFAGYDSIDSAKALVGYEFGLRARTRFSGRLPTRRCSFSVMKKAKSPPRGTRRTEILSRRRSSATTP